MNFSNEKAGKNYTGMIIVILLHIVVAYGIVSGLGKRMVATMLPPVETKIIEETKPIPPPDLEPPPPPPEMKAPPPPFIPPVEVNVAPPPTPNVIANATTAKPQTTDLQPTAPASKTVEAAPAAPTGVRVAAVVTFGANCAKPEYPAVSIRNEESGTSAMSFLIGVDGKVVESKVTKSSGSRNLDRAAIEALKKCTFKPGTVDGKPEQSWAPVNYVWNLDG